MSPRELPSVAAVLGHPALAEIVTRRGLGLAKAAVRDLQADARRRGSAPAWATDPAGYAAPVEAWLVERVGPGYRRVFNLTGTLLHSNLGRAPLGEAIAAAGLAAATAPLTLEYDLDSGRRGDREGIVEERLKQLTGAAAATVVNNNAAAVLLLLNTLALNRPVPVSRGELIEIGGSLRIPDIMARAGCRLVEVGATNRTHLQDYAGAIDAETPLLLKVHPSNYRIEGFASAVDTRALAALGAERGLPLCVDLGSGALVDLSRFGLPHEPTPRETLAAGASLVTFSGDKLLGGPQAGLIVGSAELVARLKSNPLKRALRLDKVSLALLDATLRAYEDETTLLRDIPLLATLTIPLERLTARAAAVAQTLVDVLPDGFEVANQAVSCQLGSGALPEQRVPSWAVAVRTPGGQAPARLARRLRHLPRPVIGRVHDGRVWLDMRCAEPLDELLESLRALK